MDHDDIFFGASADPLYAKLFCSLYGLKAPVLPIGSIMHWQAMVSAWGCKDLVPSDVTTYVATGYFYGIHSSLPTEDQLQGMEERARELGARWILIPNVPWASHGIHMDDAGYYRLPWFYECEYRTRASLDQDLYAQLGKSTYKNALRLVRKAEALYRYHVVSPVSNPSCLLTFDRMHQKNLDKYGHGRNTHSMERLKLIEQSPLWDKVVVGCRFELDSGIPVQGSLSMACSHTKTMLMLVQGIDHDIVPREQNLYIAETIQLYRWAEGCAIPRVNLGRGGAFAKAGIGANTFHVLGHYVKSLEGIHLGEVLKPLHDAASAQIRRDTEAIRARTRSPENLVIHGIET